MSLPNVHCWGQVRNPLPASYEAVKSFPHATRPEPTIIYRELGPRPLNGRIWTTSPRETDGVWRREWCPLSPHDFNQPDFGAVESYQCCQRAPTRPGIPLGHHLCGACLWPTWIEIHGCADGYCRRCGYHG